MAMTLRLTPQESRALDLLANAQGISKNEAATRAIVAAAVKLVDDATVTQLARDTLAGFASTENAIRQARR